MDDATGAHLHRGESGANGDVIVTGSPQSSKTIFLPVSLETYPTTRILWML